MALPILASPEIADIYIDESSTQLRYLVLGAIIIPCSNYDGFIDLLRIARLPELPHNEMKWVKVSRTKLPAYVRFVDVFFNHRRGIIDFHSVVIDRSRQKHEIFNQGSREIGFNKEVYQLALKCGRLHPNIFHVYPDRRETN